MRIVPNDPKKINPKTIAELWIKSQGSYNILLEDASIRENVIKTVTDYYTKFSQDVLYEVYIKLLK